jgi:23S rRNA (cytosine1962-C5)-methyltransferase
MAVATLKPGTVQPVWLGHPWVFRQAIADLEGAPGPGDPVEVRDPRGTFLGRGFWSPKSAIPIRMVCRRPDEALDGAAIERRVENAVALRRQLGFPAPGDDGFRAVNAEGDSLPGLRVDVFGRTAVLQITTWGLERQRDRAVAALCRVLPVETVLELRDLRGRRDEGLPREPALEVLRGPERTTLAFAERGLTYELELSLAQKTGFYFDQRDNRRRLEELAAGARVLDLYTYAGAFALAAARGGAREVEAVDRSGPALAVGGRAAARHGLDVRFSRADIKRLLPELAARGERYDIVVLDPPKLAPTRRHLQRAEGAYRRLNAAALKLVADGGLLLTCSCSAALRPDHFTRLLARAGRDAQRQVTLLAIGEQAMDHPVPVAFPEGRYLKSLFLRVER